MQIAENKNDQLAKVSKNLMLSQPFYGFFLITLNKLWSDKVPTAGVCKNGINCQLIINPEFWESLSDKHKQGLLMHELLHIGFFHVTNRSDAYEHMLANISQDIEINQYIDKNYLPEGGCTLESFADMNLPEKAGWHVYYDLLKKEEEQNPDSPSGQKLQRLREANDDGQPQTSQGEMVPDHSTWEEFDELSDAEKKLIEKQIEHVLTAVAEQTEKSRGTVPGRIKDRLEKLKNIEPPKFDWKGYVRRFAGGSQKIYTKKLQRKHNKRFEENPGLKIKPRRHLLVGIDTSGSVSQTELKEFFGEIDHICKTGSDVTIIQCDTTINYIGEYKPKDPIEVHGRGGTSFDPVLEYYNANNRKYSCLIYLTDGECNTEVIVKSKMLWVISTRGEINKSLKGPQIKLN